MSETCHKLIKYLLEVGWRIAVFTDPDVAPVITKSEKQGSRTVVRTAEITCDDVAQLILSGAIAEASRSDEAVLYRLAETTCTCPTIDGVPVTGSACEVHGLEEKKP